MFRKRYFQIGVSIGMLHAAAQSYFYSKKPFANTVGESLFVGATWPVALPVILHEVLEEFQSSVDDKMSREKKNDKTKS